eukprot:COSAG06_NODE_5388_length_3511_cov_1.526084_4_plen_32_part_00
MQAALLSQQGPGSDLYMREGVCFRKTYFSIN